MPSTPPGSAGAARCEGRDPLGASGHATTLAELADALAGSERRGDAPLDGATMDSRRVAAGDVFLAARGEHTDGHEFAAEAMARGAAALVVERFLPLALPQLRVPSVAAAAGTIATLCYGERRAGLRLVGVTGTNGKTTTCEVLRACLSAPGAPAVQIGTTGVRIGERLLEASPLTTPQAPELQLWLARLAAKGASAAAIEVSSHGLAGGRVDGICFDVAVFTNLSPEHLDFHGTIERYFAAKAQLFEPERCREAVVCVDDAWGRKLAARCQVPVTTFGHSGRADVGVEVQSHGLGGITVVLRGAGLAAEGISHEVRLRSPIVGRINAANVAAAYLTALRLGVSPARCAEAIAACGPPPGRFQVLSDVGAGDPLVAVDYAHTPDALEALIATAREVVPGRVHAVLGARGGRYRAKRSEMGRTACSADRVTLTTDSPGDEEPGEIVADLLAGVREEAAVEVVVDRAEAIRAAVAAAGHGDAVVISGRGHEESQRFGARIVALDDRVVARLALGARPLTAAGSLAAAAPAAAAPAGGAASAIGVSVVIPARNAAATLAAAIGSVLAQRFPPAEILVVDDASSDGTAELAASFGPVVSVLRRGGHGPSAARNAGLAEARSPWVAFCDADDRWHPDKLSAQLEVVAADSACVLSATDWLRPGSARDWLGGAPPASPQLQADPALAPQARAGGAARAAVTVSTAQLLVLNRFQTSTVLARRDALCRIGGFDASLDGSEDWDCWLRLSRLGTVRRIPVPLVAYADSAGGVSKDLGRVYETALSAVDRQLAEGGVERGRELAAWHRLRFAVAFALGGDRPAARSCLADLRREGLLAPAVPATLRLLLPFLLTRLTRRLHS